MAHDPMIIHGDLKSGNCLKVKWTADLLGLAYTWRPVDIMKGESRTAAYLVQFPQGQVPAIELGDGRTLAQSNAIIRYLARGSSLLPDDAFRQAKIDEWLFWEQYSHEPYVATCRFHMAYLGKSKETRDPAKVERGEKALDHMERMLAIGAARAPSPVAPRAHSHDVGEGRGGRDSAAVQNSHHQTALSRILPTPSTSPQGGGEPHLFLVGPSLTIADIALYAYTHVADEGGFDLATRPHVRAWLTRCAAEIKPEKGSVP